MSSTENNIQGNNTMKLPGRTRVQDVVIDGVLVNRVLNIDATESKACAALWATGAYTQLHVGSYENPGLNSLECLNDFSAVTRLHVMLLEHRVALEPLQKHATTLTEYFCNDEMNPLLDCRNFTNLRSLRQIWNPKLNFGNDTTRLTSLFLDRYAPTDKDLSQLPAAPHLRELGLLRSGIHSLADIGRFPALEKVTINYAKMLKSVSALLGCTALKVLEIEGAKHIHDLPATLSGCTKLERLVLMKVPELENVRFVEKMPHLKWLNLIDTQVADGDLTPLIEHPSLEYVVFTSKKHFSHTEAEIRSILKNRKDS